MSLHRGTDGLVVVRDPQAKHLGLADRCVVGQGEVEADEDRQHRVAVVGPDDGDDVVKRYPGAPQLLPAEHDADVIEHRPSTGRHPRKSSSRRPVPVAVPVAVQVGPISANATQ